jgi:hypothetical protein
MPIWAAPIRLHPHAHFARRWSVCLAAPLRRTETLAPAATLYAEGLPEHFQSAEEFDVSS